jgi:alpha-beta hydrolase superfamily lysophospholipase
MGSPQAATYHPRLGRAVMTTRLALCVLSFLLLAGARVQAGIPIPETKPQAHCAGAAPANAPAAGAQARPRRLAVLLHALNSLPESMEHVCSALLESGAGAGTDVLLPELPLGPTSFADPNDVVGDLAVMVDGAWDAAAKAGRPYESIVFVGHSMGGLLARKLYVAAVGEQRRDGRVEAPFEPLLKQRLQPGKPLEDVQARPWAARVDRIVLLAGINRGWQVSHTAGIQRGMELWAGATVGRLLGALPFGGAHPIFMSAHRGSPFITQLRLQWLALPATGGPQVVQLLGTKDDLVAPSDSVDTVTGRAFTYVEVPGTGHVDVVQMQGGKEAPEVQKVRRSRFQSALTRTDRADPANFPRAVRGDGEMEVDRKVTDVVFVIHGIRDEGYWTDRIAARIEQRARARKDGREFATVTAGYGYFPMLSFLTPGARQQKVEWLMDQYTEAKFRYPNAKRFSYVGHSHGTYLLAKALEDYPAVRFENVLFAGSVVRKAYPWQDIVPRVKRVMNVRADGDWVVAWFPQALEQVRMQDVGAAGFAGFQPASAVPAVSNMPGYARGGHSAALDESWWDAIADFVIGQDFVPPGKVATEQQRTWWEHLVKGIGHAAWVLWIAIAAVLGLGLWAILRLPLREWKKTVAVGSYMWLCWFIVTEV